VLQTEVPPPLHSVGVTGGISRSGRRQPFADKTVGAVNPTSSGIGLMLSGDVNPRLHLRRALRAKEMMILIA
jgi:hypothetical protein